jgi:uncharacterized membrane protein
MSRGRHPLHVMFVHFPVALWPAHEALHVAARWLPAGATGVIGFWILAGGTLFGWIAALSGVLDWAPLARAGDSPKLTDATTHGLINGSVLIGFTAILGSEGARYPHIEHGSIFLTAEAVLIALLFLGNYFGGAVIWRNKA